MIVKQSSRKAQLIRDNIEKMRTQFWPDVQDDFLWRRNKSAGFVSIPRCITFISFVMDELAGMQVSSSYLALWCHTLDESVVIINDQEAMAFESGFTGQRAVNTWKRRMKELDRLYFIKTAPGRSGPYNYVLLLNPFKIIKMHRDDGITINTANYNALLERATEIGAGEDL